jgi:serine phosphatase RsbU (regulator of sigma subunit)
MPTAMLPDVSVARVLVADDQPPDLDALRPLLRGAGVELDHASSAQAIRDRIEAGGCDLLLLDVNEAHDPAPMHGRLHLIGELLARHPWLPIVVTTRRLTVDLAVEAMRRGARTVVQQPWDSATVAAAIVHEIGEGREQQRSGARASRELDDARTMQRALMPAALPAMPGCEVAALWRPAGAIGGDCYDATRLGDSRLALSIADVSGKGMPAALLTAHVLATTRACASATSSPRSLVAQINRALCRDTAPANFVSACQAVLDVDARTLTYTNAGHVSPLLVRRDGSVVQLTVGGPVLGVLADAAYHQEDVALCSGDRLLFYTDGITEARAADGTEFGEGRLIDLVLSLRHATAQQLVDGVLAGARAFSRALDDDVALLAVAIA